MGWNVLSKPGNKYGPCEGECEHTDCAQTRKMAKARCSICGEEIGYDVKYYMRDAEKNDLVHAVCAVEEVESK